MTGSTYTLRAPDGRVGGLLDRDYLGFTQSADIRERWLATPIPTVTVILNIGAAFGGYPRSFVTGLTDHGEFAGITPTEYLARLVPAGPEVTSVQFTWVSAA